MLVSKGGAVVNAKDAVGLRVQVLCAKYEITVNELARKCGVAPSTIYSMMNEKSKNPGVVSLQKICDGLDISVREFFNDSLFEKLDPVIK